MCIVCHMIKLVMLAHHVEEHQFLKRVRPGDVSIMDKKAAYSASQFRQNVLRQAERVQSISITKVQALVEFGNIKQASLDVFVQGILFMPRAELQPNFMHHRYEMAGLCSFCFQNRKVHLRLSWITERPQANSWHLCCALRALLVLLLYLRPNNVQFLLRGQPTQNFITKT